MPFSATLGRRPTINEKPKRLRFFQWWIFTLVTSGLYFYILGLGRGTLSTFDESDTRSHYRISKTSVLSDSPDLQPISKAVSLICNDPTVSFYQVLPMPLNPPSVLCIILTTPSNHATRMQAVLETWGRKCTHVIAASEQDDPLFHAYNIPTDIQGYWGIWDKLMQTLKLVILDQTLVNATFDYIFKADDDTYAIMENIFSFLHSLHTLSTVDQPSVYGRTMPWPKLSKLKEFPGWFSSKQNKAFGNRFYQRFSPNQTLLYPHGGPGYLMNWKYAQILTRAYFTSQNVVKGKISEDMANAVAMLWRNVTPFSTAEQLGNNGKWYERSHPESPKTMYENPPWLPWVQENIRHTRKGPSCCSSTSLSFHHMMHYDMRILDYQLYTCPNF